MLLCDSAQVAEGKLYVLGGGWSLTGPDPSPSAIAMKIEVEWNAADRPHHFELFLVDADGQPVMVETPVGLHAVEARADFTVSRPDSVPPGSPIDIPFVIPVGPLPLQPGTRYTWRLVIDGETDDSWILAFSTRALPEE
jgi:hypothetical protein